MERLREEHGDRPIALIERKHVKAMVDAKAATPTAARNLLQLLRVLMAFAIEAGICRDDPTIGVSTPNKIKGHATWEEADRDDEPAPCRTLSCPQCRCAH